jgi:NADPH-dependent glutamate synthase beta subunit-like oxidoreductase
MSAERNIDQGDSSRIVTAVDFSDRLPPSPGTASVTAGDVGVTTAGPAGTACAGVGCDDCEA